MKSVTLEIENDFLRIWFYLSKKIKYMLHEYTVYAAEFKTEKPFWNLEFGHCIAEIKWFNNDLNGKKPFQAYV